MTDEEKKAAYLEWINYLENAQYGEEVDGEVIETPARVELAIEELMRLESLPAGATGVTAESVADLSRSFGAAQSIGLIPASVRKLLLIKVRMI